MISLPVIVENSDDFMVRGATQGHWTYADWEALDHQDHRYEIINGVLYMTTAPSFFHQWIVFRLIELFGAPAMQHGLGYAAIAPIGVIMPGTAPVQPDFVFVTIQNADIIHNKRIFGVPTLIIEVMSPGTAAYDNGVKKEAYQAAGVPEYAVIDPTERRVMVYRLDESGEYGDPAVFQGDDRLTFYAMPGITASTSDLFAGSPDTTL